MEHANGRVTRANMSQSYALASGKKMLAEGFNTMRESIHHVKMLQEMVSQLNLQGQSDNMTWGKEMLADGFRVMQKVHDHVKVLHAMIHPLKIQESDAIKRSKEMLEDGFNALQKARLHVKELEENVHQMNILGEYAMQNLALFTEVELKVEPKVELKVEPKMEPKMDNPSSMNKKRTFSTLQDAEQFVNQVIVMESTSLDKKQSPLSRKEYFKIRSMKGEMYTLNKQSWDDQLDVMVQSMRDREPTNTIKTIIAKNVPRNISLEESRELFERYGEIRDIYLPKNKDPNSPQYGTIYGFAIIKYHSEKDSARAVRAFSEHGLYIRGKKVTLEFAKSDTSPYEEKQSRHRKSAKITESVLSTNKELDVKPESAPVSVESLSSATIVAETTPYVLQTSHEIKTIIVRNLPRTITLEELRESFQRYGFIRNINLPINKDPHSPYYGTIRKFAFIQYDTAAESDHAVCEISTHGHFIYGNQVTAAKSDTATLVDNPTLSR